MVAPCFVKIADDSRRSEHLLNCLYNIFYYILWCIIISQLVAIYFIRSSGVMEHGMQTVYITFLSEKERRGVAATARTLSPLCLFILLVVPSCTYYGVCMHACMFPPPSQRCAHFVRLFTPRPPPLHHRLHRSPPSSSLRAQGKLTRRTI